MWSSRFHGTFQPFGKQPNAVGDTPASATRAAALRSVR